MNLNRRTFMRSAAAAGLATGSPWLTQAAGTSIYHVVQPGETLMQISRRYGVQLIDLMKANRLQVYAIRPGARLFIPHYSRGEDGLASFRRTLEKPQRQMRDWKYLVIHHSATHQGSADSFDDYHRRKRRMANGLAYHFVIGNGTGSRDGQIEVGHRWRDQLQGGHVRSSRLNEIGIGICLVGNFEQRRPTNKQLTAFNQLVSHLQGDLFNNRLTIAGHRELPTESTLCPGRFFPLERIHKEFG